MEYENEAPKSRTQRAKEHVGRNKGKYIAGGVVAGGAYAARGVLKRGGQVIGGLARMHPKKAAGVAGGLVAVGGVGIAGYYAHRKKKRAAAAATYE